MFGEYGHENGAANRLVDEYEVLFEVLRLMAGGVIVAPCRYPQHVASTWFNDAGHPVCGVCHPPA
jgi:hypothetical protein